MPGVMLVRVIGMQHEFEIFHPKGCEIRIGVNQRGSQHLFVERNRFREICHEEVHGKNGKSAAVVVCGHPGFVCALGSHPCPLFFLFFNCAYVVRNSRWLFAPANENESAAGQDEKATQKPRDLDDSPSLDNHSLAAYLQVVLLARHEDARMNEPGDAQHDEEYPRNHERFIFQRDASRSHTQKLQHAKCS
jgi:hypothetical protein